jgi:hypothetical protein
MSILKNLFIVFLTYMPTAAGAYFLADIITLFFPDMGLLVLIILVLMSMFTFLHFHHKYVK